METKQSAGSNKTDRAGQLIMKWEKKESHFQPQENHLKSIIVTWFIQETMLTRHTLTS